LLLKAWHAHFLSPDGGSCTASWSRGAIADYVAELRRLSVKCNFGDYLEQALWDKLVCGL